MSYPIKRCPISEYSDDFTYTNGISPVKNGRLNQLASARATAIASIMQHSAAYGSPCSNISSVYMCFDHLIHGSVNRTVPRHQVVLQVQWLRFIAEYGLSNHFMEVANWRAMGGTKSWLVRGCTSGVRHAGQWSWSGQGTLWYPSCKGYKPRAKDNPKTRMCTPFWDMGCGNGMSPNVDKKAPQPLTTYMEVS